MGQQGSCPCIQVTVSAVPPYKNSCNSNFHHVTEFLLNQGRRSRGGWGGFGLPTFLAANIANSAHNYSLVLLS